MKVREALKEKEVLEELSRGLNKLTGVFLDDKALAEQIADKGNIPLPLVNILTCTRDVVDRQIKEIQNKIDSAEIPD